MEFNWIISAMDCKIQDGEMTDVVQTVHWRYNLSELKKNKNHFAEMYGATKIEEPILNDFTPYQDLTKEQVVSWLESKLDVKSMKENLTRQINLQKSPINILYPSPFK